MEDKNNGRMGWDQFLFLFLGPILWNYQISAFNFVSYCYFLSGVWDHWYCREVCILVNVTFTSTAHLNSSLQSLPEISVAQNKNRVHLQVSFIKWRTLANAVHYGQHLMSVALPSVMQDHHCPCVKSSSSVVALLYKTYKISCVRSFSALNIRNSWRMGNGDPALQRAALIIRCYFLHSQHNTKVGIKVHAFATVGTPLIQTLFVRCNFWGSLHLEWIRTDSSSGIHGERVDTKSPHHIFYNYKGCHPVCL